MSIAAVTIDGVELVASAAWPEKQQSSTRIITGLTKALQETGRADETARSIATRAAGAGFAGIAQNMAQVYQGDRAGPRRYQRGLC